MTRKDALAELIAKVEAGEWSGNYHETRLSGINAHSYGLNKSGIVWEAYNGSLDAALALHEAVLPGWHWSADSEDRGVCVFTHLLDDAQVGRSDTPACAWLLAILKALHAQEADTHRQRGGYTGGV